MLTVFSSIDISSNGQIHLIFMAFLITPYVQLPRLDLLYKYYAGSILLLTPEYSFRICVSPYALTFITIFMKCSVSISLGGWMLAGCWNVTSKIFF